MLGAMAREDGSDHRVSFARLPVGSSSTTFAACTTPVRSSGPRMRARSSGWCFAYHAAPRSRPEAAAGDRGAGARRRTHRSVGVSGRHIFRTLAAHAAAGLSHSRRRTGSRIRPDLVWARASVARLPHLRARTSRSHTASVADPDRGADAQLQLIGGKRALNVATSRRRRACPDSSGVVITAVWRTADSPRVESAWLPFSPASAVATPRRPDPFTVSPAAQKRRARATRLVRRVRVLGG